MVFSFDASAVPSGYYKLCIDFAGDGDFSTQVGASAAVSTLTVLGAGTSFAPLELAGSPAAPTLAATCPRPHVPGMCPKGGDLARGAAVGGAAVGCDGRARVGAARDA